MAEDYKHRFLLTEETYLLNHSVGRPPVTAAQVWADRFLADWENQGDNVWHCWLDAIESFNLALCRLLNSPAENFCSQVNLSSALTKILQSLPKKTGRDTIVFSEEDFPSIAFVLQQATRYGYKLRVIPTDQDTTQSATWSNSLNESTAMVLVTHVQSNSGRQVPVAEITAFAKANDIISIVDIAQSAGVVHVDLENWFADFVIGSSVKWLCGGPGAAYLWVRPEILSSCKPLDVGWFSHEDPFEFDIYSFRYAENADRFLGGTPSVQPFIIAANSINTICDIGVETIRQRNVTLTERLIDALAPGNLVSPANSSQRGGTVVVTFETELQAQVVARLKSQGVLFDTRPSGIRLSPHIYNDEADIDAVIKCLPG